MIRATRFRPILTSTGAALLFAAVPLGWPAQVAQRSTAPAGTTTPLVLSAAFARATVRSGEPAYLILSITNPSPDVIGLGMMKYPPMNYRLELENSNHEPINHFAPTGLSVGGSASVVKIRPNASVQNLVDIAGEFPIADPGKYFVRATLSARALAGPITISSNWADITVTSPDAPQNRDTLLPLELTAHPLQNEIYLGQGASFEITLRSFARSPIQVDQPSGSELRANIVGPDGSPVPPNERQRQLDEYWLRAFPRSRVELQPGGRLQSLLNLRERYDFATPGRYIISFYQIVLDSAGVEHEVRARPVEVVVRP